MKKIICLTLIIMLINLFAVTSNAESINSANLYSKKYFTGLLKKDNIKLECNMVVYKKDGVEYPAYCLQKDLPGVTLDAQYSVSIDSLVSNAMVWRTIINGYPYKTIEELGCNTEEEAFFATKQAVYCAIYNRDPNVYSAQGEAGERCLSALKKIVSAARNSSTTKNSSNIEIKTENSKWELDKINKNCISQIFNVTSQAPMHSYLINITGEIPEGTKVVDINNNEKTEFDTNEKFKVIIPLKNIMKDNNFTINVKGEVNTKPVLYGKSSDANFQDYALTASVYEEGEGTKKVYYNRNSTKIIIIKKDENSGSLMEGVEFELLDEKQNILYTDLKTDNQGKIEIDNILPGTYYIRETKTLEGYNICDKLIKVTLSLNEAVTINVVNSENTVDVTLETKNTEMTVKETEREISVKLPKTGM